MRYKNSFLIVGMSLAISVLAPLQASAQKAGADFTRLQTILKDNDNVTVTNEDGSAFQGRLLQLSAQSMVLKMRSGTMDLSAAKIAKVQRRQNGVLLGAIIGGGAMVPLAITINELSYNEGGGKNSGLVLIPVGMLVGAGIDALFSSNRTVYDRNSKNRISVGPMLDRNDRGVKFALKF